jgi:carboxyl-terminal processing protease
MKSPKLKILLITITAALFLGAADLYYLKINKAFDIFSAVFEAVSSTYVVETDPDILLKDAINGMTSGLDKYTEYYDNEDSDDIQFLTHGTYVGFGFSVRNIDSMLTITDVVKGYSAQTSGITPGDKIVSIDSNNVLFLDAGDLKKYTRGKAGSKAVFKVIKLAGNDTLDLLLTRNVIKVPDIDYHQLLPSDIAYIKLSRFTTQSTSEFKNALSSLAETTTLKGLIIDLRGNPGGLLTSAIEISEMFLPMGSIVVKTKGYSARSQREYRVLDDPEYPDLPMAILLDEGSASASEVLAGAMQDHDRAIIVGRKSFGKGLVQSVISLPHDADMKITTARYFTPSGRCIQKSGYGGKHVKEAIHKDSIFYTDGGRPVIESDGIHPDTSLTDYKFKYIAEDAVASNVIFEFVNYLENNRIINSDINSFIKWLDETKKYNSLFLSMEANKLKESFENYGINPKTLEDNLWKSIKEIIVTSKDDIQSRIAIEKAKRVTDSDSYKQLILQYDREISFAQDLLSEEAYKDLLLNDTKDSINRH